MRTGWGRKRLRQRCREFRELLEANPHLATAEELTAYWPGGKENALPPDGQWIYCYAQYSALWRRGEHRDDPTDPTYVQVEAEHATLDALREKALTVELMTLAPNGSRQTVTVYPKSFDALSLISELNDLILRAQAEVQRLQTVWTFEDSLKASEYQRQITTLHLVQCWVLTHPGCESPFDSGADVPALPESFTAWDVLDVLAVMRAHHQLHAVRIDLISKYLHATHHEGGKPATWDSVVVGAANRQKQPVEVLLRRRSFGAWYAQAVITWRDELEQANRAKAEAAMKRPPATAGML